MKSIAIGWVFGAITAVAEPTFEHCLFDAIDLNGAWEMAYRPYARESCTLPDFKGVVVTNAIPGYWEDMVPSFRAAGMADEFRINPLHVTQRFPISGYATDTTLPNIYGSFFYRRQVVLDREGEAVLAFEGVRNQVHVWINGRFIALRQGFSTPFELAIPVGVLRRGANEIVLAVSNNPNLGYGDQVIGLTTRAVFGATGGVNGRLELRFPKSKLADVYVTTAVDLKSFTVHVAGNERFDWQIADGSRVIAHGSANGDFTLPTDRYQFWSPERPQRYELSLTTVSGVYRQRFGIRRLTADGVKLRLNGEPVYLRGVTEHCYFPKTVHLPRDLDYYRMITRKRKELGFNFVRFHTFVPPVEYFEATDELGMLVHVESPNFVSEPEYAAIIAFARRHPSVVIFCTGNETRIDRLAETYLEDVANLVHTRSDALFSPMSALRGLEYALMPGKDVIVDRPFKHNPERFARVSRYADVYTAYQQSVTSYSTLNRGTAADLDEMASVYGGKPQLAHEICIDGSYADLSLEQLYPKDSPILKTGLFSEIRRQLTERGLINRADTYFRNSCEWMRRIRKHAFEKIRASDFTAGYDFLGDINTHWHTFGYSVGMMDEFYRLKPGETPQNVRRYNDAAVLLANLGNDFNLIAGSTKSIRFSVSNYARELASAKFLARLVDDAGRTVGEREVAIGRVANGKISSLAEIALAIPNDASPRAYRLRAELIAGAFHIDNEWELYAFPKCTAKSAPANVRVATRMSKADLLSAMAKGERVLLLDADPFKSLPTSYQIGLAGRCAGNYATVIAPNHSALAGLPHAGFCGWQFRRLMEGGRAVQLEADVPFDPIIDIASSVKYVIRQALMFEYRVGDGRLLVAAFNFGGNDPAAAWLRNRLIEYAAGERFTPQSALTPDQLAALIDAPLKSGAANTNLARNPNDSSSNVRAGDLAQP